MKYYERANVNPIQILNSKVVSIRVHGVASIGAVATWSSVLDPYKSYHGTNTWQMYISKSVIHSACCAARMRCKQKYWWSFPYLNYSSQDGLSMPRKHEQYQTLYKRDSSCSKMYSVVGSDLNVFITQWKRYIAWTGYIQYLQYSGIMYQTWPRVAVTMLRVM